MTHLARGRIRRALLLLLVCGGGACRTGSGGQVTGPGPAAAETFVDGIACTDVLRARSLSGSSFQGPMLPPAWRDWRKQQCFVSPLFGIVQTAAGGAAGAGTLRGTDAGRRLVLPPLAPAKHPLRLDLPELNLGELPVPSS